MAILLSKQKSLLLWKYDISRMVSRTLSFGWEILYIQSSSKMKENGSISVKEECIASQILDPS